MIRISTEVLIWMGSLGCLAVTVILISSNLLTEAVLSAFVTGVFVGISTLYSPVSRHPTSGNIK